MKKLAFFAALAAVAVVGCNKQEIENPVDSGRSIVVHVTAENNPTRGEYNDDGQFIWKTGDKIGVNMYDVEGGHNYGTWSAPLELTDGADTPDGTFAFEGTNPSYVHYGTAAFYPYDGTNQPASNVGENGNMFFYLPASINYKEGVSRMMLVGALEQDATDIKLYQAGAGIRITLKDVPARATKVSLTVKDMSIANIWPAIAPADAGNAPASAPTGGESTVTYNIATADAVRDMVFTYAVPVQNYAGAKLTVTVADNNSAIWSKGGTITTSPGRGEILAMPELTVKDPSEIYYLSYRDGSGIHHNKVLKFSKGSGSADDPFTVTGSLPEVGYAYIERGDGVTYNFPNYVEGNSGVAYIEYGGSHPNEVMYIAPNDVLKYSLVINDANSVTLSYEVLAVDLGLSVKWATMNVGASNETDRGDYLAWGETEPYYLSFNNDGPVFLATNAGYVRSNYFDKNWTKYAISKLTTLLPIDDAATRTLGDSWRIPTSVEMTELINTKGAEGYTWIWCDGNTEKYKDSDLTGWKIVRARGTFPAATLFLPAVGDINEKTVYNFGTKGFYWSSSQSDKGDNYATDVEFDSSTIKVAFGYKSLGFSVRPVYAK